MNRDWETLAERYEWGGFVLTAADLVGRAHGVLLGAGVLYTGSGMVPLIQAGPELLGRERASRMSHPADCFQSPRSIRRICGNCCRSRRIRRLS
jgi:hypothetical protein